MNKKYFILTLILAVIIIAIIIASTNNNNEQVSDDNDTATVETIDLQEVDFSPIKEFTVTGKNLTFTPNTLRVRQGDKVKITFKNEGGTHDLVIPDYNISTKQLEGGMKETIEFFANEAGVFEFYCSVGNHREMGMKGTLIVIAAMGEKL